MAPKPRAVEEIPAPALFESAGRVQARIGEDIFPVHAAALPDGQGAVKLLRLHDGHSVLCYPIDTVIDIVRLPEAVLPAAAPGLIAGVVLVGLVAHRRQRRGLGSREVRTGDVRRLRRRHLRHPLNAGLEQSC